MAEPMRIRAQSQGGDAIVRVLMSHEMESGQRKDSAGNTVPRKIIKEFSATLNGKRVFRAVWHPAISANPYQSFFVQVQESGTFEFAWTDDDGSVYKSSAKITVS